MSSGSFLFVSERRLRAPWRILFFVCTALALYVVGGALASSVLPRVASPSTQLIVYTWVSAAAIVVATWIAVNWIDRESWSFVNLNRRAARPELLVSGLLIGAVAIGIPCVLLLATHELKILPDADGSWTMAALRAAMLLLPAALFEEVAIRGYLFSVLRETIGWRGALVATSIVFGAIHMANPAATVQPILVVVIAGFFLGTIVLITDSLYAAWMAHFAWNWTLAGALHTSVSGLGMATPDYRVVDNGPSWLTGGAWGPEASIAAALGMFGFLFYFFAKHLRRLSEQPSRGQLVEHSRNTPPA